MADPIRCPFCRHDVPTGRVTCRYCSNRLPDYLRQQVLAAKESERRQREAAKAQAAAERAARQQQVQAATAEVEKMNSLLEERVEELESLLSRTLSVDDYLDFEVLKDSPDIPEYEPGTLGTPTPRPAMAHPVLQLPTEPNFLSKLFGGKKRYEEEVKAAQENHRAAVTAAENAHTIALAAHGKKEQQRLDQLAAAKIEHEETAQKLREELKEQHRRVEEFKAEFEARSSDAVCAYFDLVLQRSSYPEDFPKTSRLAFVPDSRQLVVEYELPLLEAIPQVSAYKYVKAKNLITETSRPVRQRKQLYSSVVAQVTIRTLHELFEADRSQMLETIVFNGMVSSIDKGTGQAIRPCLVTVRTTREQFEALDLSRVEPLACLRTLNAAVSKSPAELAPVRPVLEFNMVDPRFVDSQDVISELDQRPNLMELSPTEFESLIANLFDRMGLEMRQTRPSRDGGVDCVAYCQRRLKTARESPVENCAF